MAEHRPFPPSPRRRALARRAGLVAASPHLVAAGAWIGAIVALLVVARSAGAKIGAWIAASCGAADGTGGDGAGHASAADRGATSSIGVAGEIVEIALPVLAAIAIAAIAAHFAQTRSLWLPRRKIPGAPSVPPTRTRTATFELAAGAAFGGLAFGWLWWAAPHLAQVRTLAGAATLLAGFVTALAIAWIAAGVLDLLIRTADTTSALAMTAAEKREDDRLAAADPRWREQRRVRQSAAEAMPGASLLLLGDDVAVAIAWDPIRRPVPTRVAHGDGARATQLLGLARRHRVPVHRDAALARELLGDGPVPERDWARLAEVIAAVRRDA